MKTPEQQIVDKTIGLLEVESIYINNASSDYGSRKIWIVILMDGCSDFTLKLSPVVSKLFQEEKGLAFFIFPFQYAERQLKCDNLFFVNGCTPDKMIFRNENSPPNVFHAHRITEKGLENVLADYIKERDKITAFFQGGIFYFEKGRFAQAAFMFHQVIELWYRFGVLVFMGMERKTHCIKELQAYVKSSLPELGSLFSGDNKEDQQIIKLLDEAYIASRYRNDFEVGKEQLVRIMAKAEWTEKFLKGLFWENFEDVKVNLEKFRSNLS